MNQRRSSPLAPAGAISVLAPWPRLDDWAGSKPKHPLRSDYEGLPGQRAALSVLEDVIVDLEAAGPPGLGGKRKQLKTASSWQDCLDIRTELLVAAKLLAAGIPFVFLPTTGSPQPDIEINSGALRLEVTNRWVPGRSSLEETLEAQLKGTGFTIGILCSTEPARITDDQRGQICDAVAAQVATGTAFTLEEDVVGTGGRTATLTITGTPGPAGAELVTWEVASAELTDHMADVEAYLRNKLTDIQKNAQAQAAATVLIIEASRTGNGWVRPDWVWDRKLQALLDSTVSNFVGLVVVFTDLVSRDLRAISAADASATPAIQTIIGEVQAALATPHPAPKVALLVRIWRRIRERFAARALERHLARLRNSPQ